MTDQESMIAWLEHRISRSVYYTIPIYVGQFEDMWMEKFGTLDTVPRELKDKVNDRYKKLKLASS